VAMLHKKFMKETDNLRITSNYAQK